VITTLAARCLVLLLAATAPFQSTAQSDAPVITHAGANSLAKGEDLVIEATVTGSRPIARVTFGYRVGDRFGDVPLTRSAGSTWRARISASRFTGSFSYIIHASDEGGRVTAWPASAQGHAVTLTEPAKPPLERHLLYVAVPGVRNYVEYGGAGVLVFDIAHEHRFVKRIPTIDAPAGQAPENVKGVALSAQTGLLYVTTPRRMFAVDVVTERVVWNREYDGGCDRMALSPDGTILYVPSLEGPHWHAVDARRRCPRQNRDEVRRTTRFTSDGTPCISRSRVTALHVADPRTHAVRTRRPVQQHDPPFTVNGRQTLCFVNLEWAARLQRAICRREK
jgi:hypothetical protein